MNDIVVATCSSVCNEKFYTDPNNRSIKLNKKARSILHIDLRINEC